MKYKVLAILHFIVLCFIIWLNYYFNSGAVDGKTVGEVSDQYQNLFTPAPYAFAIWGIIYLGLIAFGINLLKVAFSKSNDDKSLILKSAPWLILANLGNGTWLWFWLNEQTLVTVIIMIAILLFLIKAVINLNMEKWDAPLKTIVLVWWPIDLYIGWISVALVANVSAHLSSIGWSSAFSEETWFVLVIGLVLLLNLAMIAKRNMREFAAVGIWALLAIAVRHWNELQHLAWVSIAAAILIGLATAFHAYRNRATLPFVRRD